MPQLCIHCGSDRLIRLSFSDPEPDDRGHPDVVGQLEREEPPNRPTMKCLGCGERLYAADLRSPTGSNAGTVPMPATKHAVVIIERLRSIGRASQTPTLGDLRRTLGRISEVPDDAELSLQISGVLDSNVMVNWDVEARTRPGSTRHNAGRLRAAARNHGKTTRVRSTSG